MNRLLLGALVLLLAVALSEQGRHKRISEWSSHNGKQIADYSHQQRSRFHPYAPLSPAHWVANFLLVNKDDVPSNKNKVETQIAAPTEGDNNGLNGVDYLIALYRQLKAAYIEIKKLMRTLTRESSFSAKQAMEDILDLIETYESTLVYTGEVNDLKEIYDIAKKVGSNPVSNQEENSNYGELVVIPESDEAENEKDDYDKDEGYEEDEFSNDDLLPDDED